MKIGFETEYITVSILGLAVGFFSTVCMMAQGLLRITAIIVLCLCLFATLFYMTRLDKKLKTMAVIILIMILGYLSSCVFINSYMGKISADEISPSYQGAGTALLLLSPGEMRDYSASGAVYRLKVNRSTYTAGASWWSMPVKVWAIRKDLKAVDKDILSQFNQSLYNKVNNSYGAEYRVYNANLFGPPYIETVTKEILKNGHDRVIVMCNFLIQQPYNEAINNKILSIMEKSGLRTEVIYTFPLWNHDNIASMYEKRICYATQEIGPENIGIVLMTRGCSEKARKLYGEAYKREEVFLNKIKEDMIKNGFDSRKIKTAYLRYREPSLGAEIESLLDNGVSKIVVAAAGYENPCIDTEHIIPRLISRLKIPKGVDVAYIGSWGDDDLLVRALGDRLKLIIDGTKQ